MASNLELPRAIPVPRRRPHAFSPLDASETKPRDQGEQRRMPLYATVPQLLEAEWFLTQAQFDLFADFYEDDLAAGAERFDLRVAQQGTSGLQHGARLTYWTAQFIEPYRVVTRGRSHYVVSATLLLLGSPFDIRVAPGILASGRDRDTGRVLFAGLPIRAHGTDADTGGAVFPAEGLFASGTDADTGAWRTGLEPEGGSADDELAMVWMGLAGAPGSLATDDAASAALMGI